MWAQMVGYIDLVIEESPRGRRVIYVRELSGGSPKGY